MSDSLQMIVLLHSPTEPLNPFPQRDSRRPRHASNLCVSAAQDPVEGESLSSQSPHWKPVSINSAKAHVSPPARSAGGLF